MNPRPREICLMKKTGVQKSRETVPLNTASDEPVSFGEGDENLFLHLKQLIVSEVNMAFFIS